MAVGLKVERAEGLLVLGEILSQNIPQRLGLLRAQKDALLIADVDLLGALAGSQAENEQKVPHADAHLHAVGIDFAIVRGLG